MNQTESLSKTGTDKSENPSPRVGYGLTEALSSLLLTTSRLFPLVFAWEILKRCMSKRSSETPPWVEKSDDAAQKSS